jgi:Na+/H+ antiporter NhaD/arsenite permease-like protein
MEDLKTLLLGIAGGLLVLAISKAYRAYRRKSIQDDISFTEYEKKHLEEMKRSSVEMNRSSFRALFALCLLIGLANLIPMFLKFVNAEKLSEISSLISLVIWSVFVGLSIKFWRRYDNLKNYKEATRKMDEKLEILQVKLQKNS